MKRSWMLVGNKGDPKSIKKGMVQAFFFDPQEVPKTARCHVIKILFCHGRALH